METLFLPFALRHHPDGVSTPLLHLINRETILGGRGQRVTNRVINRIIYTTYWVERAMKCDYRARHFLIKAGWQDTPLTLWNLAKTFK